VLGFTPTLGQSRVVTPNLSQWKEGSHDSYLWVWVNRGGVPNLFIYMVYVVSVGSKHENDSLFQNLGINIAEFQTLRGIILLGGDFNARITALPNTINISDLCELL
jgi:endonuclease/exonuclease/phosphatase (EEP) superfamily protein YafD